ncbi:acyl carrier protein [Saccharopolyspora sp. MS10]|uniref:acyl carrier protein n=1 Tax=Saccharopolyspora sp. MS10 TaxID=3385973 RepID=UPI0039A2EC9C
MSNADITEKLKAILNNHFDIPAGEIDATQNLDDAGLDSVAAVELADIIREELGVTLGEDELLVEETTLEQLQQLVAAKLEAGA